MLAPLLLLLMRVLQGAAIGGEVPGAWVFVAEHVPAPPHRHRLRHADRGADGRHPARLGGGDGDQHYAQPAEHRRRRLAYSVPAGRGVFGLVAMYLRRWLQETPIFLEMQPRKALAEELPVKAVVLNQKREVVVSMLLTWLLSAGIVVVILMSPAWLQKQYGFAPAVTLQANSIATIMLFVGCLAAGLAADRFGASVTFMVGSLLLAGCSWLFYQTVGVHPEQLFACYTALVGLCVGVVGAVPYVMVRAFPPEVRFTGISFSYNVSYAIFGGLTPIAVTVLMGVSPMAPAWYVLALSLMGLVLGFYLHRDLNSEAGERRADSYS